MRKAEIIRRHLTRSYEGQENIILLFYFTKVVYINNLMARLKQTVEKRADMSMGLDFLCTRT